jgi:small subunit ribosomal protein S18
MFFKPRKPLNKKAMLANKKKRKTRVREQVKCRFCREKGKEIDYKDIPGLSKLVTQHGKLFSRKRSGNCASCQRKVKQAVKWARFLSLMPYVT